MTRYLAIGALILALALGGLAWWQASVARAAEIRAVEAERALAVAATRAGQTKRALAASAARAAEAQAANETLQAALSALDQRETSNASCKLDPDTLRDLRGLRALDG